MNCQTPFRDRISTTWPCLHHGVGPRYKTHLSRLTPQRYSKSLRSSKPHSPISPALQRLAAHWPRRSLFLQRRQDRSLIIFTRIRLLGPHSLISRRQHNDISLARLARLAPAYTVPFGDGVYSTTHLPPSTSDTSLCLLPLLPTAAWGRSLFRLERPAAIFACLVA
ncbi:hypothetical protein BDW02DRAFT_64307 [Decorospora gaudefroyi]|uniref:Uncharacterized protein n=1 Tax=Decorospora gaudefroyi TaxID=184978 RepID=A0A6A5K1Q0_9PLEO|nr:hypothetical protein BDW02DRAFT_64307 [Decorospora gaudefroyi]